jgi:hypothetical protein
MIDQIYVIDNVIPKNYQELIKDTLFDTYNQEWYLKRSLSENTIDPYPNEGFADAPGFANVFYNNLGITNPRVYNRVMPMVHTACDSIDFKFNKVLFGRSFLQMPMSTHEGITNPHVDVQQSHLVCLYYVIDADGETVFFNKKDDPPGSPRPSFKEYDIEHKIEPKQGRVVLFNGSIYHANILPKTGMRCVVNLSLD